MSKRLVPLCLVVTAIAGGAFAQTASADTNGFSCRASAVRVSLPGLPPLIQPFTLEPFVANQNGSPCTTDSKALLQPTTIGPVAASILTATTSSTNGGHAAASVAGAVVGVPGLPVISAQVLQSRADASCAGVHPTLSGSSTVLTLKIGTSTITLPNDDAPATIPLGPLGNIFVNQQTVSNGQLTRRALYVDSPLAKVAIAESIADIEGSPCGGTAPPPTH